jgi:hypothetical protein
MDGDFCVNRSQEASFSRSAGVFAGAQAKQLIVARMRRQRPWMAIFAWS